jgi:hypothetical protein
MARGRKGKRSEQIAKNSKKRAEWKKRLSSGWLYFFDRQGVYHTGLTQTGRINAEKDGNCTVDLDCPETQITIAQESLSDPKTDVFRLTYKKSWTQGNFVYHIKAWHSRGARKIQLRQGYIREDGHVTTTFPHLLIVNGQTKYDYR